MSGLFERIARRRATPPDETREVEASAIAASASPGGGEPAPTDAPPPAGADHATPANDANATAEHRTGDETATAELGVGAGETAKLDAGETAELATGETASQDEGGDTAGSDVPAVAPAPSFRERGRVRRRLRYLRRVRELQLRDLGGLVFELSRFGRQREDLVTAKVSQLAATDDELRNLEVVLDDRRALVELREPGVGGTCPTCGALHGSADRFCAQCGRPLIEQEAQPTEAETRPLAEQPNGGAPGAESGSPHEGSHVA
jgi:hypothetical protein